MIYLLTFFIASLFFYLGEHSRERYTRITLNTIAVLLPCVLAGCRDYSVGADIGTYALPTFDAALAIDDPLYWTAFMIVGSELLYWWLPWILARFTENGHWLLFATQLLITGPTYFALKKYKKLFAIDMWFAMLLWNLAMYNLSLNAMRQSIAISFVFLAMAYLIERQYRLVFTYMVIAFGFHNSGLFGIAIICLYWIVRQEITPTWVRRLRQLAILLVFSVVFTAASIAAFQLLMSYGVLKVGYSVYTMGTINTFFSVPRILAYLFYLVVALLHYPLLIRRRVEWLFFTVLSFIVLLGQAISAISADMWRLSWYFWPLQIVSLCMVGRCYQAVSRCVWLGVITSFAMLCWYVVFIAGDYGTTANYIFSLEK